MFESARLKIKRADEHIDQLSTLLQRFVNDNRERIIREFEPNNPMQMIRFDALNPPPMIPLIVGDVAHNLRAALDHVAGEIRRDAGGDDSKGHFPISDTRKAVEKSVATHIEPFDPSVARAILDEIDTSDARNEPIRAINLLDNVDKHRRLTLAITTTGAQAGGVHLPGGGFIGSIRSTDTSILMIGPNLNQVQFEQDFQPTVSVVFGVGEPFEGKAVIPTLTQASEFIANAVSICERNRA